MEHKSIKEQEVELIQELAHLEKDIEKQIDLVLDMRTYLLRDQDAIKAYVAALDPREQSQVEYVNAKRKTCQHNFSGLQEHLIDLRKIYSNFDSKWLNFNILLNPDKEDLKMPDEEGNPEYTAIRMPESNYYLDSKDIVREKVK